jgi:DNA processing protein
MHSDYDKTAPLWPDEPSPIAGPAPLPIIEPAPRPLSEPERKVLDALGYAPTTLEMLANRTDMDDTLLQGTLLGLELAGRLSVLPGGWYVRARSR